MDGLTWELPSKPLMFIIFMLLIYYSDIRDVEVMKKAPSKGQHPPYHTIKGKGMIHASPELVLKFLINQETSKKVDELLKEGVF